MTTPQLAQVAKRDLHGDTMTQDHFTSGPDGRCATYDKVMLVGDTHGSTTALVSAMEWAAECGADAAFVLGDFGYWEHAQSGVEFLDDASAAASDLDLDLLWLDGNHENHELLGQRYHPDPDHGLTEIRDRVWHVPRATRMMLGAVSTLVVGGATSIDKLFRVRDANLGGAVSWWPGEELTDDELVAAARGPSADLLLTHDYPLGSQPPLPPESHLPATWRHMLPECSAHAAKIRAVLDATTPKIAVHGHLHIAYESEVGNTQVIGLSFHAASLQHRTLMLHTDKAVPTTSNPAAETT